MVIAEAFGFSSAAAAMVVNTLMAVTVAIMVGVMAGAVIEAAMTKAMVVGMAAATKLELRYLAGAL